jgi:ACS family hexuronate transporter-like MFS transporter
MNTDESLPARASRLKWWICGLLLLATMLNYMDRLTLNQTVVEIKAEFGLNARHYGYVEAWFANAFALGGLIFGWMADRWSVRWIYPAAILAWSAAGFATGLSQTFWGLLFFRFCLGLAEAGNWPCALRTTQHVLPPSERPMGNSILQSGAAIGAIVTPVLVMALVNGEGTWRYPFLVIGLIGILWVALWLKTIRREDLAIPTVTPTPYLITLLAVLATLMGADALSHMLLPEGDPKTMWVKIAVTVLGIAVVFIWLKHVTRDDTAVPRAVFVRRFWVLVALVVTLNATWHFFRAWTPLFLREQHGYTAPELQRFSTGYYIISDIGCLIAGFVTLRLARRGLPVHWSRVIVFAACSLLTMSSVILAMLPTGPWVPVLLFLIGFAALGLFPNYYSFSQEITVQYQGKVTGALGCTCWLTMSLLHELVGDSVEKTGNYSKGVALAGLLPLIGVAALVVFWGKSPERSEPEPAKAPVPVEKPIQAAVADVMPAT